MCGSQPHMYYNPYSSGLSSGGQASSALFSTIRHIGAQATRFFLIIVGTERVAVGAFCNALFNFV